jgi:hypothetical protein
LRLTITLSGNSVDISWQVPGAHLQSQNSLGSTWTDVPNPTGTNHLTVPIDTSTTSVFYRLAMP